MTVVLSIQRAHAGETNKIDNRSLPANPNWTTKAKYNTEDEA